MNRASVVEMRKSLEMVEVFKKVGLRFVPMPVTHEADFQATMAEMQRKLDEIEGLASDPHPPSRLCMCEDCAPSFEKEPHNDKA